MSEERDESPKPQEPRLKRPDLFAESAERDPANTDSSLKGLRRDRNTAEISGEMTEVVGEATGEFPPPPSDKGSGENTGRGAFMVAAGILISRLIGVVRQRVFAHYLGLSDAGGAFNAAFRIPNFLQNVFGEGALSASFIPVYANLLARGDKEEASRVAGSKLAANRPTKNRVVRTPTSTIIEVATARSVRTASATRDASSLSPLASRFA